MASITIDAINFPLALVPKFKSSYSLEYSEVHFGYKGFEICFSYICFSTFNYTRFEAYLAMMNCI